MPHNSPSSSSKVALIGTSDPSILSTPSQSPTSAASGLSGVGAGRGVAVGGIDVARGVAAGAGEGAAVGVGRGVAVGTGEGTTVGVGEGAAVGVGGAGRGPIGPHVLANTAATPSGSASAMSVLSAPWRAASVPIRVSVVNRVEFFRAMQPGCHENVSMSYFTISHS